MHKYNSDATTGNVRCQRLTCRELVLLKDPGVLAHFAEQPGLENTGARIVNREVVLYQLIV